MLKPPRHGQVTIFVIIGLVLLLIVGVLLLRDPVREPSTLAAQADAARVSATVESCLALTGEDALRDIGARGGYADLSGLRATPDQRSTQVVTIPPQDIPLWHEVHPCAENPAGCLGANRPRLCTADRGCPVLSLGASADAPSIQEALERATASRVAACIAQARLEPVLIEVQDEPQVTATIREDEILLSLTYPLTMTATDGSQADLETFRTSLDVALPRAYRLAAGIADAQVQQSFIEEAFLHLLAIYSGADTPLPPVREVRLFGAQKYWVRAQVQQVIEEDLLPFLNFLQVINARESFTPIIPEDPTDPYAPYETGAYEYLVIRLGNTSYPLEARFEYPDTPIFLDLGGRELVRPTSLAGGGVFAKLAGLVFTQYRVKYTVAFPLVVHVRDPAAFNGEGFELAFGLEGNLRSNYPLNTSASVVRAVAPDIGADIADPGQLVRHGYRIVARDRRTSEPLQEATVTFSCGARVQMGITGVDGTWTGQLPYCLAGGEILVEKFGYLAAGQELVNIADDDATSQVELQAWPMARVRAIVFKRSSADIAAVTASGPTPDSLTTHRTALGTKDQVLATIARQKERPFEDDVPLAGAFSVGAIGGGERRALAEIVASLDALVAQGTMTPQERDELLVSATEAMNSSSEMRFITDTQVDLVPGTYDIELLLMHNGLVMIPAERRCEEILGGLGGEKCVELPAQNLSGWVSGGAILMGADAITLTPEFIYSGRPLVLFALEQELPTTWTQMERYQDLRAYQTYDRVAMVQPET